MKKTYKILACLFAFILLGSAVSVSAAEIPVNPQYPLVFDEYDILTDSEESQLQSIMEEVTAGRSCTVAVAVIDSFDTYDTEAGADDFYDYNGYGYGDNDDGILMVVCMGTRDWAFTTHGLAETAFNADALDALSSAIVPYLSNGDYANAFYVYARLCDEILESAENGVPYGTKTTAEKLFSGGRLFGAILIGLLFAWLSLAKHLKALKTVEMKQSATDYVKENSLKLTGQRDIFLYHQLSVMPKPRESASRARPSSSSHISSSGRSHGGSHGKF